MLHLFMLVLGVWFSQCVADAVIASRPGSLSAWSSAVAVQYLICLGLLVLFDGAPLSQALSSTAALICFVRVFFFIRRL